MKPKSTLFCLMFALCANTSITVYAQAVNKQDSLALVDLYNSADGPNWSDHTNWLTKRPVKSWSGIEVTGSRVTGLNLNVNNLNGTISPSIGNLVKLTFLYLGLNQLRGNIPSSIGNLVNVDDLRINDNELSGSLPSSMGNLKNLTYLALHSNQLSSLPSSIGNLQNLQYLDASSNQLDGSIPSSIGNCKNLGWLNLSYNQLNSIPSSIGDAKNIYYLDLSNNKLSGSIPASLGNLVNLDELLLSNNQLTGNIPSSFGNLLKIENMYLDNNQLSGSIPFSIGNIGGGNIHILNLSHNKLSAKIPSSFANFASSIEVNLSYNHFTFDGMEMVARKLPAIYDHQAPIPVHQNGNALSVSAGGTLSNNTYKWFRCGKTGNTLAATIKGDSVFHPSQNGIYHVKVANSIATQLILASETIKYVAPTQFVEAASTSSSENALQQYKLGMFVYPNPAKDILHVQTNGKATLTLTDQAGKGLLTQTIEGNGVISVASLPVGLYYLKNTQTGTTQKVIMAK